MAESAVEATKQEKKKHIMDNKKAKAEILTIRDINL
jgi:hypothetical protein